MSIVIKICNCDGNGTVRRRVFNASNVTLGQVQELANLQNNNKLTWRDEDNDVIVVENQFDLQEAISYAVTQNSSLRLIVDNTGASAETEPTPVHANSTSTSRTPLSTMQSAVTKGYEKLISTAKIAKSALTSSKTFQGIQEDAASIRGFLDARVVERNRVPIQLFWGVVARGALLWGLFFGASYWLLLSIIIGTLLTPRNALTRSANEQIRILFGLLALRTVVGCLFGVTCCLMLILLGSAFAAWISFKFNRRRRSNSIRRARRRNNGQQSTTSNDRFSQQEHKDIETLRGIFPALNIEILKEAYMRHRDIQNTVLELSK